MGVNEQINRIKNAVAAIKTAIAGKGVNVPAGTLVDGLADYIDEIKQLDVSGADAGTGDVVSGKKFVGAAGTVQTGTMPNQGTKTATLDTSTTSYTIPAGKHSGSGKVSITTQEKSVSPSTSAQTVTPDSGKVLSKVSVSAVPSATQATPSISVDSAGKITASATQEAGYVAAGTKSATKQLTTKGATTITPSTSAQTAVSAGTYCTGDIKVAAVTGGSYNSGTIIPSYGTSLTINTAKTISSSAKFVLVYNDSLYDTVRWHDEGPTLITAAFKDGSTTKASIAEGSYDDSVGSYSYLNSYNVTITYSGSVVTISSDYPHFVNATYKWYVFG